MRRERTGCMLAKPFEPRIWEKWKGVIVQPKINGVRCIATVFDSRQVDGTIPVLLSSSTQKEIKGFQQLEKELSLLPPGVYDGELYKHGMPFQEISGIVRTENRLLVTDVKKDKLEYWIFDQLYLSKPQLWRLEQLFSYRHLFPFQSKVRFVHSKVYADHIVDLFGLRDSAKAAGYEGIILRNPNGLYEMKKSNNLLKMKVKYKQWFEIKDLFEEHDQYLNPKDALGAIDLETETGARFSAGTGLTAEDRQFFWKIVDIRGWWALIEYPELTSRGVPHQPSIITISKEKGASQ